MPGLVGVAEKHCFVRQERMGAGGSILVVLNVIESSEFGRMG